MVLLLGQATSISSASQPNVLEIPVKFFKIKLELRQMTHGAISAVLDTQHSCVKFEPLARGCLVLHDWRTLCVYLGLGCDIFQEF